MVIALGGLLGVPELGAEGLYESLSRAGQLGDHRSGGYHGIKTFPKLMKADTKGLSKQIHF